MAMVPAEVGLWVQRTLATYAELDDPEWVTIKIGKRKHRVNLSLVPYFKTFIHFERSCGRERKVYKHGALPRIGTALTGLHRGFRHCLSELGANLEAYYELLETLDFLQVAAPGHDLNLNFCFSFRESYQLSPSKVKQWRQPYSGITRYDPREMLFHKLVRILTADGDEADMDGETVLGVVTAVLENLETFRRDDDRVVLRRAWEERFAPDEQARNELDETLCRFFNHGEGRHQVDRLGKTRSLSFAAVTSSTDDNSFPDCSE